MSEAPSPDLDRAARAIEDFLEAIGHPPSSDPELEETGRLVAQAFAEDLLSGYASRPSEVLAESFPSESPGMVILRDVSTVAICPHHLLPAPGVVHLGYLPAGRLVGLGALGRLVQCCARRLALQEQIGQIIAEALCAELGSEFAACVVDLSPACVTARGGRQQGARAVVQAFAGSRRADPGLRSEFLASLR
ncbi:MAG: GTP cyclohydrolase I [Myxococcales bacterium]|nr:GTP cyclohydrolase I [Myxococcales bacterium]